MAHAGSGQKDERATKRRWTPARLPLAAAAFAATTLFAAPALAYTISGTVFEDIDADLLNGGAVGDAGNPGVSGVTVRLMSGGGAVLQTDTTGADGSYSFSRGVLLGETVYVVVDTVNRNAAGAVTGGISEQTYASSGTGGGDSGTLCVGDAPTYSQQPATTTSGTSINRANGACYGGRRGAVATANTNLNTREHVTRIQVQCLILGCGDNITDVDFGFSFNAVTNTNDTGQGALRQFIENANTISGDNDMRFVPAIAPDDGTGSWWRVVMSATPSQFFEISDAGTTVDGTARSNADGQTVLDTNSSVTSSVAVGTNGYGGATANIGGPELEINRPDPDNLTRSMFLVRGSDFTLRGTALTGANFQIVRDGSNLTNMVVEDNYLGLQPDGSPPSSVSTVNINLTVVPDNIQTGADFNEWIIRRNAFFRGTNITIGDGNIYNGNSYTIENNHFSTTNINNIAIRLGISGPAVSASPVNSATIRHNYFTGHGTSIDELGSFDALIEGNTFEATELPLYFADVGRDPVPSTVRGNIFTGSTGAGFGAGVLNDNRQLLRITQNSFSDNEMNSIDLSNFLYDGPTPITATGGNCPSSGTANGGIPRPEITSASVSGSTLVVSGNVCDSGTYDIEFYTVGADATGDTGSDGNQAGEGEFYIGTISVDGTATNGTFTNQTLTVPGTVSLAIGDSITAIAINTSAGTNDGGGTIGVGSTSEFSANAVLSNAISGTVFEDVDADLLNGGAVGDPSNPGIEGVIVHLMDSAGGHVAATTTDASGAYSFSTLADDTYYVVAAAPLVDAAGQTGVLAEQTYGSAGTGGGSGGGTGNGTHGTLCVMGTPPTYTDQPADNLSGTAANPANGACYGGRRGAVADDAPQFLTPTSWTSVLGEHVTRVVVSSGVGVGGVDFGFSFNAVTNTNDTGQGSLRQFIANANAIAGANAMRFVPAMAADAGAGSWWAVASASSMPVLTDSGTTVDGTAFSNQDGTSAFSQSAIGTGGAVGAEWNTTAIGQVPSPLLAIAAGHGSGDLLPIQAGANATTIRDMGLYATVANGNAGISNLSSGTLTDLTVENNVIGVLPDATSAPGSLTFGIWNIANTNGSFTIADNYVAEISAYGVALMANTQSALGSYVVSGNEVRDTGGDGIRVEAGASYTTVEGNLVADFGDVGIEMWNNGGNNLVRHNTVTGGGGSGVEAYGIRLSGGTGNLLQWNRVIEGGADVVGIGQENNGGQNRLTQNQFGGNGAIAIDNYPSTGADGESSGDGCVVNTTQLDRPVISSATLSGTTLTVSGTFCGNGDTYDLEFYTALPDSGTETAGEGIYYIGTLTLTGGTYTDETLTVPGTVTLADGDFITAIALRNNGASPDDTSEFSVNAEIAPIPVDYGDAPAPYPTLAADNGANHVTGSGLFLGTLEGDPDTDGQPSAAADGDDLNDTSGTAAGDDEDGVTLPAGGFAAGSSMDIMVEASQAGGVLNAWIDWNGDGDWDDAGEQVATDAAMAAGGNTVSVSVPAGLSSGTTFARFRLSTDTGLSYIGTAGDGEVEDYEVAIVGEVDYGDAPNSYLTTDASNGARHTIPASPSLYLGQTPPDADDGTLANAGATADDLDGTSDEDGVILPDSFIPGESEDVSVWVTGSGLLNAWFDWDGSGTFDAGEQVASDQAVSAGATVLNVAVPAGAVPGTTYARFRLCSAAGECSAVTGLASDGEVEDYAIVIGDTMTVSGTVFEDNGAGGGTAHDGTQDAGEAVFADVTVEARDDGTDALLATAVTDADGNYALALPASAAGTAVRIAPAPPATLIAVSEDPGTPNGLTNPSTTDGQIVFTPQAGTPVPDVDFGYVRAPTLTLDRTLTMQPGGTVAIPHTYTSHTAGDVTFTLQNAVLNPTSAFAGTLYLDADCSAAIEGGEGVISGPVTVAAGDTVCLLVRVQTASGAAEGSTMEYDIVADTAFSASTVTSQLANHDVITVTEGVTLDLVKRVRNVTQGASSFGTTNAGGPGNVLEYQVVFTNPSSETAMNVTVHDRTPPWTSLEVGAGAFVQTTPTGMSCSVVTPAAQVDGYTGPLEWSCTGDLAPGEQGEVRFQVQIDQ